MRITCSHVWYYRFENGTTEMHTCVLKGMMRQQREEKFGKIVKEIKMR